MGIKLILYKSDTNFKLIQKKVKELLTFNIGLVVFYCYKSGELRFSKHSEKGGLD
jgi:hypothetical protein